MASVAKRRSGGIMPSPPRKSETQKAFMSRCIPTFKKEGMKQDQAVAACFSMWRKKHGGKKPSKSEECKSDTEALKKFSLEWEALREDDKVESDHNKMKELERMSLEDGSANTGFREATG